jgi:hypothetical protein
MITDQQINDLKPFIMAFLKLQKSGDLRNRDVVTFAEIILEILD